MTAGTIGTNFIRGRKPAINNYAPALQVRNYAREQSIIFQDPNTGVYSGGYDGVNKTTVGVNGVDWTTVVSADKRTITLNVLSATGRNFINETFPNPQTPFQPPLEIGKFYAFVCKVESFAGPVGSNNMQIAAGGVGLATVVVGYNVIRFQATATTAQCRIGVGPGGALGAGGTMTLSDMWFTEIESLTANVPDYVPPNSTALMKYAAGNTVVGNVLTLKQGVPTGNPPDGMSVGGVGDSMSTDYYEWPNFIPQIKPGRSIRMMSQALRTMEDMATMMPLLINKDGQSASLADFSVFVVQAGTNDIFANRTAVQILGYLDTIFSYLPPTCKRVVCEIPPFGNSGNYNVSREAERVAFNTAIGLRQDVTVAPVAAALTQQQFAVTLPDPLELAFGGGLYPDFRDPMLTAGTAGAAGVMSLGDEVHPNTMAQMVTAALISGAIDVAVAKSAAAGQIYYVQN